MAVKTSLQAWCVKTAKELNASHKALEEVLKIYRPIAESIHAVLTLKNSDPRIMAMRGTFMRQTDVSLGAVMRAYTEYSTVLHSKGHTSLALFAAVLISTDRRPKKDKLPNYGTCEHPHHKEKCRHSSRDCRILKKYSNGAPIRDAQGNIVIFLYVKLN